MLGSVKSIIVSVQSTSSVHNSSLVIVGGKSTWHQTHSYIDASFFIFFLFFIFFIFLFIFFFFVLVVPLSLLSLVIINYCPYWQVYTMWQNSLSIDNRVFTVSSYSLYIYPLCTTGCCGYLWDWSVCDRGAEGASLTELEAYGCVAIIQIVCTVCNVYLLDFSMRCWQCVWPHVWWSIAPIVLLVTYPMK